MIVERIEHAKEDNHEGEVSKGALTVPEYGSENDILEMHPNVPTPELGYYEDLNRMCFIFFIS